MGGGAARYQQMQNRSRVGPSDPSAQNVQNRQAQEAHGPANFFEAREQSGWEGVKKKQDPTTSAFPLGAIAPNSNWNDLGKLDASKLKEQDKDKQDRDRRFRPDVGFQDRGGQGNGLRPDVGFQDREVDNGLRPDVGFTPAPELNARELDRNFGDQGDWSNIGGGGAGAGINDAMRPWMQIDALRNGLP